MDKTYNKLTLNGAEGKRLAYIDQKNEIIIDGRPDELEAIAVAQPETVAGCVAMLFLEIAKCRYGHECN